jgi:hypothetical protein
MLPPMPVCPFCRTDNPMPSLPCGACGKLMKEHPSFSSGQSYSVKPGVRTSGQMAAVTPASRAEPPELELSSRHAPKRPSTDKAPSLPPPPVKKPAAARSPGPTSGAPPKGPVALPGVGGAVFDEDDIFSPDGGPGAAIELEMPVGGPGPGAGAGPSAVSSPPARTMASKPPVSMAKVPVGTSRGVLVQRNDSDEESEARTLADYGDSPDSFWKAPLYAYRVKTRQSELRRQLHERQTDLKRAEKAEEQAKIAFAERARPIAERLEGYAQALEPIAKTERVMMDRGGALSAEVEAHKSRLAVIDERVHGLEGELETAKAEEREIEGKLAEAEGIRQRADAKLKRAEIEIRNATTVAEAGGVKLGPARRAGSPS